MNTALIHLIFKYWLIFLHFSEQSSKQTLSHYFFLNMFILFRTCFSIFPHKFAQKKPATPFFLEFLKMFVYVLSFFSILLRRDTKKTRLHLLIHDWCFRPYISECFLHFSSQMLPKQRGYTIFHLFFTDFCCCPFSFLHFCWNVLQKKRGYTFEGSNDKNCGAFYALGRPWKFIVNNST